MDEILGALYSLLIILMHTISFYFFISLINLHILINKKDSLIKD